ncbi:unnamed protein product, partial [marine sediment metagenome]
NSAVEETKDEKGKTLSSPLINFNFEHDIKNNTFYLDFRNTTGWDDFILLQELSRDNYDND